MFGDLGDDSIVPGGIDALLRLDDLGASLAPLLSKILNMYPVTY